MASVRRDISEVLVNQNYFLALLNAQMTPVLGRWLEMEDFQKLLERAKSLHSLRNGSILPTTGINPNALLVPFNPWLKIE